MEREELPRGSGGGRYKIGMLPCSELDSGDGYIAVHMYQSIRLYTLRGGNKWYVENASIKLLFFLNMLRLSSCTLDGGTRLLGNIQRTWELQSLLL